MIAPDFRNCESASIEQPAKNFIAYNYGDGMWNDLAADIGGVEVTHNQMATAPQHKTNAAQLEKFAAVFSQNARNMQSFNKYFSFGTQKTQLNVKFVWSDSFSNQKVTGSTALLD